MTADGDASCDMEFVDKDGDVGVWRRTSTAGWMTTPTDGSGRGAAGAEVHVEGLDVDGGNLVGLVPTERHFPLQNAAETPLWRAGKWFGYRRRACRGLPTARGAST